MIQQFPVTAPELETRRSLGSCGPRPDLRATERGSRAPVASTRRSKREGGRAPTVNSSDRDGRGWPGPAANAYLTNGAQRAGALCDGRRAPLMMPGGFDGFCLIQADQACASTTRTSTSSTVTTSGAIDAILWLIASAASSDSKITIPNPDSSFRVQYPVTNPGACDTPGTTSSRRLLRAASMSSSVTLTTTACTGALLCRCWHGDSIPAGSTSMSLPTVDRRASDGGRHEVVTAELRESARWGRAQRVAA